MIAVFKAVLSVFMSVLCFFTSGIFGHYAEKLAPADAENVKLTASVISDLHLTDSSLRAAMLELGLYDMQEAEYQNDLLLLVGDNTDSGCNEEYENLADTIAKYTPAKRILMAEGNHDTWTVDDHYEIAEQMFSIFNKQITGTDEPHAWYSATVNGYPFIFLGSEEDHTYAVLTQEQLTWFAGEMEKAAQTGLPIFVVCHWPINQTHGLPDTWGPEEYEPDEGGLGDQSEAVWNILTKYSETNNIFYISGHVHSGFTNETDSKLYGYKSIESYGSLHLINLPSYMYMTYRGRIANGTGYQMEVYEDRVLFRARSFAAGVWYTLYDYDIPLK